MRRLALNMLLALISMLLTLSMLELGARLLPPPLDGSSNPADTCSAVTGWRGKPHFSTTAATEEYTHQLQLNSRGMHDEEHTFAKPDDTFRILLLGDSFVQAVQVRQAETSHQLLEELLNQHVDETPVEVISAGVGGWGTGQQLLYYRTEGRLYQPDLVLLLFYMGNDVKDNLPGRGVTVAGYNCYSPFFNVVDGRLDPQPWYFAPGLAPPLGDAAPLQKSLNNMAGRLYQQSHLYAQLEPLLSRPQLQASVMDFYMGANPVFSYAFDLTQQLVQQLAHEVHADGAQFGVVLIAPLNLLDFSRASPAERAQIYAEFPAMRRAEEIEPPNVMLYETFTAADIPTLDLFPPFMAHVEQTGRMPFFIHDKHWDTTGNRLAAEAMFQWLVENEMLR